MSADRRIGLTYGQSLEESGTIPSIDFENIPVLAQQEQVIFLAQPKYPALAKQAEKSGHVRMAIKVGSDGMLADYKILQSEPMQMFDRSVIEALQNSRFKPYSVNGQPSAYQFRVIFQFRLGK